MLAVVVGTRGDAEVMSHVTAHFGKSLEECREEVSLESTLCQQVFLNYLSQIHKLLQLYRCFQSGLTVDIMEEFKHFWHEDFEVVHRELGCAIICMSNKYTLLDDDARLHHDNMEDYVKSFPNGKELHVTFLPHNITTTTLCQGLSKYNF